MLENVLVGIIVLAALVWAIREAVKAVRRRRAPAPAAAAPPRATARLWR